MKTLFLSVLILCISLITASAQSPTYKAALKKMLQSSGTEESFKAAIKQMTAMFKQQYTSVPQEVWNDFEKEFSSTSMDDLVEMLTPVYEKHLTEADLNKLIEFYQTPFGKKYAEKTPLIMQESMQVGQQWGMKLGQKFQEKMKEKGY